MIKPLVIALFIWVAPSNIEADRLLEAFAGIPVYLDAKVETPATFDKSNTLPIPKTGDTITLQIFAPESADKKSLGYDITFEIAGKSIGNFLSRPSGTTWEGAALNQSQGSHSVTSLLLSQPAYPSSGFWGTIEFQVIAPLSEEDVLVVTEGFVGDVNTDRDALDVSNASIVFTDKVEALGGDIDLDGDVDFIDFLTFAGNFGKTGPPPSPAATQTIIVTVRDTITDTRVTTVRETITVNKTDTLTVTRRDTVEVVKSIRDTVFANFSDTLPPINLQARVDIQSGAGDKIYTQNTTLSTESNTGSTLVTVEIFAAGFSKVQGFQAIFRVDDPSKISKVSGKGRDGFDFAIEDFKNDGITLSVAGASEYSDSNSGFQYMGAMTFEVSGSVNLTFESYESGRPDGYTISYNPYINLGVSLTRSSTTSQGARQRAENLLGFWKFDYTIITDWSEEVQMQSIDVLPHDDGEYWVNGIHKSGKPAFGTYLIDSGDYAIITEDIFYSYLIQFNIAGNSAVGAIWYWETALETIADAWTYSLLPTSGRTLGFSLGKIVTEEHKTEKLNASPQQHRAGDIVKQIVEKLQKRMGK